MSQLWTLLRDNPKTVIGTITFLIACGASIARTEEAVEKVPQLEKAVVTLEKIHEKQAGREEGIKEGERKTIERLCVQGKLDREMCEELD